MLGLFCYYHVVIRQDQGNSDPYKLFEFKELLLVLLHSDNCITRIIIVYRPPISVKNGLTLGAFLINFPCYWNAWCTLLEIYSLKMEISISMLMIHLTEPQVNSWIS